MAKKVKKPTAKKAAPKKAPAKKSPSKKTPTKKLMKKPSKSVVSVPKKLNLNLLISPLDDRVLVQENPGERVTAGGIIIPDTAEISGNQRATVVAVGRGHLDNKGRIRPLDVSIGDQVLVREHSGDLIQIAGHDLRILRESEILGILD